MPATPFHLMYGKNPPEFSSFSHKTRLLLRDSGHPYKGGGRTTLLWRS